MAKVLVLLGFKLYQAYESKQADKNRFSTSQSQKGQVFFHDFQIKTGESDHVKSHFTAS